jgi:hypothetical protein
MEEFTQYVKSLLQIPLINFLSGALVALVTAYLYHHFSIVREENIIKRTTKNVVELLNTEININKYILYDNYKTIGSNDAVNYWQYRETQTKGMDILSDSLEKIKPDWKRIKSIFEIYSDFNLINKEINVLSEYAKKEWERNRSDIPNRSVQSKIRNTLIKIWDYQKDTDYNKYEIDNVRKNMQDEIIKRVSTSDNANYRK